MRWNDQYDPHHAGTDCFNPDCPVNVEFRGGNVNDVTQGGVTDSLRSELEKLAKDALKEHGPHGYMPENFGYASSHVLDAIWPRIQAALSEQQGGHYNDRATEVWREGYYKLAEERNSLRTQLTELQAENEKCLDALKNEERRAITNGAENVDLRAQLAEQQTELSRFKPQPMSQLCRDGEHAQECVGCRCLCHTRDAEVAKLCAWQKAAAEERIALRERLNEARMLLEGVQAWANGSDTSRFKLLTIDGFLRALTEQQELG